MIRKILSLFRRRHYCYKVVKADLTSATVCKGHLHDMVQYKIGEWVTANPGANNFLFVFNSEFSARKFSPLGHIFLAETDQPRWAVRTRDHNMLYAGTTGPAGTLFVTRVKLIKEI